jgi:hypothetical protein
MQQIGGRKDVDVDPDLVRHMILNSLRSYRSRFSEEFGELVLCYDSKHYWRREYFPNYKKNRKRDRDASGLDWNTIFETLNAIRDELREIFPYKVLEVYGAEADDIIATLCKHYSVKEPILVLSGDKDFIQLHKYDGVKQYSPVQKKFVKDIDPHTYIKEHVLKGDRSDGVPNFLSPDNTFVEDMRQKPLQKKKLEVWIDLEPEQFCNDEMMRNYQRNFNLINLDCIPEPLEEKILDEFDGASSGDRSQLLNYFVKNRLKELMTNIGDF